ncbi:hypothetical protein PYH37_001696 [Sinorhizobium numidicum]|uniref:Uncharacterized protein n=1 Tax=Sinorhizobium numidicum TaxID=680248 RepID=A0ABY8CNQ8_9HYPH|nr:hypothetical protein [Sinorhizobium numidicum]WEX74294.1 hypothetical protein PYH37_001696 [Sinorhizobium numidicum]WEX80280.1 hypothetical protein PYH38_001697 [Sinorhizobium numidicum]
MKRRNLSRANIDLWELNEAFAAVRRPADLLPARKAEGASPRKRHSARPISTSGRRATQFNAWQRQIVSHCGRS